jgi:ribonuclease VapC
MIVDTSAIVAIVRGEPEAQSFSTTLHQKRPTSISAANYLEAGIVIDGGRDAVASTRLDATMNKLGVEIEPVTEVQARIARQAYRDFGRGSGHPAKLNFGDCFAYALAMERGDALLYKGDDFFYAGLARVV